MKYILELEDEPNKEYFGEGNYYRCKQIPYWSISESMRNRLEPYDEADRKTENSSEKPNNCEDEQMETQTETQNSNLTFEKVMEEIQTQVIEFPDTHQKFTFARKIEMDGDSIKIGDWEYKGAKKKG